VQLALSVEAFTAADLDRALALERDRADRITSTIMLAIAGAGVCDCNQEIQSLNEAVTPGGDRREHRRHWATRDP
jgi:hypothetical protein